MFLLLHELETKLTGFFPLSYCRDYWLTTKNEVPNDFFYYIYCPILESPDGHSHWELNIHIVEINVQVSHVSYLGPDRH